MSQKIDAHQHFWRYSSAEYGWIDNAMRVIRRDFLPHDLAPHLAQAGIAGTVAVQARQSLAETDWLLELADAHATIQGVVGWVPLARQGSAIAGLLDAYCARSARFKGVRHVLQEEPDTYFSDPAFNAALAEVAKRGLTYDLLIYADQLPAALAWADRHPALPIVVDHIAKPVVQGSPPPKWRKLLGELGEREHVSCKFSGVVTEVPGWQWEPAVLQPYFDVVLETFGPSRVMFGSDWPVCLVAADYARWHGFVCDCVAPLAPAERAAILGGTATAFYHLQP